MRRRSGGLHCNTSEDLLKLANLLQSNTGLFYDERKSQILIDHQSPDEAEGSNGGNHPRCRKKQNFVGHRLQNFDYDQERERQLKVERELEVQEKQIEKMTKKVEVVVLTEQNPPVVCNRMMKRVYLGEKEERIIDLLVRKDKINQYYLVKCFWVINASHVNNSIVEVYLLKVNKILNTCAELELKKEILAQKVIRCKEEDVEEKVQALFI